MMTTVLILIAGLMGAGGVVLAAASAHAAPGTGLDSAAYLLILHAIAVVAGTSWLDSGRLWHPALMAALIGWVVGGVLFSGDIALRALAHSRLFPMAAPTGGTILIAAWLALAVAAVVMLRR